MSRLLDLIPKLRSHPGTILPNSRYETLVAFIEGVALGEATSPLAGFYGWLVSETGGRSPLHWSVQIAWMVVPDVSLASLSGDDEERVKATLLDILQRFVEAHPDGAAARLYSDYPEA